MSKFIVNDATRSDPPTRTTARGISSPPMQRPEIVSLPVTQTSACRSDDMSIMRFHLFNFSIAWCHKVKADPMIDGSARVSECVTHRVNAICVLLGLHQLVADGIADDCSGRSDV